MELVHSESCELGDTRSNIENIHSDINCTPVWPFGAEFVLLYTFDGDDPGDLPFRKGGVLTVTSTTMICAIDLDHHWFRSTFRHQAIIRCKTKLLWTVHIGTNFIGKWTRKLHFTITKRHLKITCAKCRQPCPQFVSLKSVAWWRHQMEAFSALLALCAGNSPVTGEFSSQRPVTRSFDAFFDLGLEVTVE